MKVMVTLSTERLTDYIFVFNGSFGSHVENALSAQRRSGVCVKVAKVLKLDRMDKTGVSRKRAGGI